MNYLALILLSLGLSFDTYTISISCGLALKEEKILNSVKIAFTLAFFQGSMLFLGWLAGFQIKEYITTFDHWVAFVLLFLLGIKMIIESFKKEKKKNNFNPLNFWILISISMATSIDALAVGISYALFNTNIAIACLILAIITDCASLLGIFCGKKIGKFAGNKIEIIGGIILIIIGTKILIEHSFM